MAPCKGHFYLTIIYIFLCTVLTFTAAEETNLDYCVFVMRKYCRTYSNDKDPTALQCIQMAVGHWSRDSMPEGILKDYYEGFAENPETLTSLSRDVRTREEFCSQQLINDNDGCKGTLSVFKDTKESTLDYALYSITTHDLFTDVTSFGDHGTLMINMKDDYSLYFLNDIRTRIQVDEGVIPDPVEYCTQRCTSLSSLLDWTPYLEQIKNMRI